MVLSPTVFRNYLFVMIKRILAELTEYACEMTKQAKGISVLTSIYVFMSVYLNPMINYN